MDQLKTPLVSTWKTRCRDALQSMPAGMMQKDAVKVVKDLLEADLEPRPLGFEIRDLKHMGPAVGWAFLQNTLTWMIFLLSPFVLNLVSDSQWFVFIFLYILTSLLLKVMVARYTLPCFIRVCGPSLFARPRLYAVCMVMLSAINSLDVITNTVFVSGLSKTSNWAWIMWLLMLLQPLYVIAMAMPIGLKQNFHSKTEPKESFPWHYQIPSAGTQTAVYRTFWEDTQTHQGALLALAHGGRMQCVIVHAQSYLTEFHATRQCCQPAAKFLKQQMLRSFLFTISETVLFLTVKGEIAISSCNDGECNYVAVAGAVVGSLTGIHTLYQDSTAMWALLCDVLKGNWNFWTCLTAEERERRGMEAEKQALKQAFLYIALQALVSGACVVALLRLPLLLLWPVLRQCFT